MQKKCERQEVFRLRRYGHAQLFWQVKQPPFRGPIGSPDSLAIAPVMKPTKRKTSNTRKNFIYNHHLFSEISIYSSKQLDT